MAFLATFLRPVFSASRVQHVSDLQLKFALGHSMCGSMADVQSATAEIRRGKIQKDRKKDRRRNYRAKIKWPALLHTAAIIIQI